MPEAFEHSPREPLARTEIAMLPAPPALIRGNSPEDHADLASVLLLDLGLKVLVRPLSVLAAVLAALTALIGIVVFVHDLTLSSGTSPGRSRRSP
jgi:hypothetical protein